MHFPVHRRSATGYPQQRSSSLCAINNVPKHLCSFCISPTPRKVMILSLVEPPAGGIAQIGTRDAFRHNGFLPKQCHRATAKAIVQAPSAWGGPARSSDRAACGSRERVPLGCRMKLGGKPFASRQRGDPLAGLAFGAGDSGLGHLG